MTTNEAARGHLPGKEGVFAAENVREIFVGACSSPPVVNYLVPPGHARKHEHSSRWTSRRASRWAKSGREAGMATAEYAIATLAAVGFAGLLVVILKSDEVRGFLLNIIRTALSF